ncbi:2-hydroxychromene-2-carboxylate isomerase [Pikeienuella piscinae]|uniref:2-hydroxychromene-2-carboxylate isomerase n=1 Tax=Pikeienuella piscinae TaxID=2748098 RepID=A0A7L5BZC7_9RHOB|nr:2-hydroxychromene-2-carboxylate isomerase [Pikeienuella piscinae]QIE56188.1 2-hydroxychromene-2-carboxylate isomerase [Pikeienuella piscinae]
MSHVIEYFYSIRSSFAYLGAARLNALAAEHGVTVSHHPMDLLALVEGRYAFDGARTTDRPHAGARVMEKDPIRESYTQLEYRRWGKHLGIGINVDPSHHYGPRELPSGAVIAAQRRGLDAGRLSHAILEALWRDDRDIAAVKIIAEIVDGLELGVAGVLLCEEAMRADIQEEMQANTREAARRGVFGSPTYIWKDELFFGQDRLEFLRRAIDGSEASPT